MTLYALRAAGLFDFLKQITDFIGSIIKFVMQMVDGLIRLLKLLPKCVTEAEAALWDGGMSDE